MSTENNSIIERDKQEVAVSTISGGDIVEKFKARKTEDGKFLLFDDYRYGLGGRGIWGTKIFYRALEEMNILEKCKDTKITSSNYCPTEEALTKYPNVFAIKEESNMWGFSLNAKDEIDEKIFPILIKVARYLEKVFAEEKKEKSRARYLAKKAQDKANQRIDMGGLFA